MTTHKLHNWLINMRY